MLFLNITFPIDQPEKLVIESNIKPEYREEVLANFIRMQIGTGKDNRPPEQHKVYTIQIQWDCGEDTFYCTHDCGAKELREGILLDVLKRMGSEKPS